jgi:Peptidase family M41
MKYGNFQLKFQIYKFHEILEHCLCVLPGANIANLCNKSAQHAARYKQKSVCGDNLEYSIKRVVGGTEKRYHAMSPEEKRVVAYHETGYALVGWMLQYTNALLKVWRHKITVQSHFRNTPAKLAKRGFKGIYLHCSVS